MKLDTPEGRLECRSTRTRRLQRRNAEEIFRVFMPTAIEYVVKDTDSEKKLEDMEKRGITLVRIEKEGDDEQQQKAA